MSVRVSPETDLPSDLSSSPMIFYYGLIRASLAYSESNETEKSRCSDFSPTTCLRVTQGEEEGGSLLKAGLARAKHYTPLRLGTQRPIVLQARQKIGGL